MLWGERGIGFHFACFWGPKHCAELAYIVRSGRMQQAGNRTAVNLRMTEPDPWANFPSIISKVMKDWTDLGT